MDEMDDNDDRAELSRLVGAVGEQLRWLERGGRRGVPRRGSLTRAVTADEQPGEEQRPADEPRRAETPTVPAGPPPPPSPPLPVVEAASFHDPVGAEGLAAIRADLGDCHRCKLAGGRSKIVYGVGSGEAPLVFVGEGPGADEDRTGEPFVGKAGQLLTRMIAAMGYRREDVYICNVVKCRPPGNRTPEPDEVAACEPFLKRQLAAIRPRMIVALGKSAAQALLKTNAPISSFRGRFDRYAGIPLMPTFHPAYLLRTPSAKREVWEDLKKVMAELDRLGIKRPGAAGAGEGE